MDVPAQQRRRAHASPLRARPDSPTPRACSPSTGLGSVALAASGALHGKVTIPGAATNAGALVFIAGRSESALSGDDGSWRVGGIPPGKYSVAAMFGGYALGRSADVDVASAADAAVAPAPPTGRRWPSTPT